MLERDIRKVVEQRKVGLPYPGHLDDLRDRVVQADQHTISVVCDITHVEAESLVADTHTQDRVLALANSADS